jgi:hypothetical protein
VFKQPLKETSRHLAHLENPDRMAAGGPAAGAQGLGVREKGALAKRVADVAWPEVGSRLWSQGYGRIGHLLPREECEALRTRYGEPDLFRSRIDMARFQFGRGEYQYFAYPLPRIVGELRKALYPKLAEIANPWMQALSLDGGFPADLASFLERCHAQGQTRPTPLLLRYRTGDYNCLHQDLYGDAVFPFQVIVGLSRPGEDFTGGELLLTEQRPRAQSMGHAVRLEQGEAVAITTRYRPVPGARGYHRTTMRHGVSPILSGERYTLGLIFHDAA